MNKNIEYFFKPKSVAVIGASRTPGKIGNVVLANFVREFRGKIYAVNPEKANIYGIETIPSIKAVKEEIDLAVVAVPAQKVPQIVRECGMKKVKAVAIISAGFAEVGNAKLQKELENAANKYPKTAILGPNCVEGKTPVLIANNEHNKFFEMGEFINKYMEKFADKVVDFSGTKILDCNYIDKKLSVASLEGKETKYKKITKLFKRENAEGLRIKIEGNRALVCSPDHPFIVKQKEELVKIPAKKVEIGMEVPIILELPKSKNAIKEIDLVNEIQKLSPQKTEKIRLIINGKHYSFKKAGKKDFEKNKAKVTTLHGRIGLPAILPISEELCKLAGYFIADGNYKANCLQIGFIKDKSAEEELRNYINKVFDSNVDVKKTKEIKFGRRIGKLVFQEIFGIKGHAQNKAIPQFIFSAEKKQITAFLSGLFSGDGGIYEFKNGQKATLYFHSTSEKMINQAMTLLSLLGVGPFYLSKKERKEFKVKGVKWNAQPLFEIRSDSKQAIAALYELGFRFIGKEKENKLEKIVRERFKFKSRIKENIFFRKITSIEKLPQKTTLYDFEVEGTHNFFAGQILTSNCLGVLDTVTGVDMIFLPAEKLGRPGKGKVSFISQSGALGSAILDWDAMKGYGINKFVSYGNALKTDETDLLEYLGEDSSTKVIVMYVEGVKNGRKFFETAKKVGEKKPVIAIKGGLSEKGKKATLSHTASLAGDAKVFQAALKQAGIVKAKTMEEVFDFARVFSTEPKMKGKKVQILTNGGGYGVLAADAVEEQGLEFAEMKEETKNAIKSVSPEYLVLGNPTDLIGDADNERFRVSLKACLEDENIDAVLMILLFQVPRIDEKVVEAVKEVAEKRKKPLVIVSAGGSYSEQQRKRLEQYGFSTFSSPFDAAKSLKALNL